MNIAIIESNNQINLLPVDNIKNDNIKNTVKDLDHLQSTILGKLKLTLVDPKLL